MHSFSKISVTALTVLAIAGTRFGGAGMLHPGCGGVSMPAAGVPAAPVTCAKACCCGTKTLPRACGCEQNKESPALPPPKSDDSGRIVKVSPWIAVTPAFAMVAAPGRSTQTLERDVDTLPPQRSLQSLLCIWRI